MALRGILKSDRKNVQSGAFTANRQQNFLTTANTKCSIWHRAAQLEQEGTAGVWIDEGHRRNNPRQI
jgi:hypothetical protein